MRAAYPGAFGYNPSYVSGYGNGSGAETDRISNLKRAIESIEQRLQTVPPYAQPQFQQQGLGIGAGSPMQSIPNLGVMQAQLNQLSNQIGLPGSMPGSMSGSMPGSMNPPHHMAQGNAAGRPNNLNSAIAEIANRQQMLNQNSMAQPMAPPQKPAPSETFGRELSELKKELAGLRKEVAKPVAIQQSVPQAEIDRIARAIADLQAQNNPNEKAFGQLTKELSGLRNTMARDVKSALKTQSNSESVQMNSEIKSHFDELANHLGQASLRTANRVGPRVDQLGVQLESMRTTIDDLPQTLAIGRLEEQLSQMVAKLESLSKSVSNAVPPTQPVAEVDLSTVESRLDEIARALPKTHVDLSSVESRLDEVARTLPVSEVDLSTVESRLDEVARALVAVSNAGRKTPQVDLSAVDRVEARMADLARSIDVVAQQDTGPELNNLAVRIDGLTERLGSFEKYAEAGDLGGATAMFASPDTGVIEDQLRELNAKIEEAAVLSQTNNLEQQIASLSAQIEQATNVNTALAQSQSNTFEEQIASLSAQVAQATHENSSATQSWSNSLEEQIAILSARVEEAASANSTVTQSHSNLLEEQMAVLSARIEEAANVNSTATQMSNLEAQIGQIIHHLNNGETDSGFDFSPVEARLGQIENQLISNQNFSLEAAQQAAQQAVAMMGPQSEPAQIIEALSHDLKSLQTAAEAGNAQNSETILQVQSTLQQVANRLGAIENSIEEVATRPAQVVSAPPIMPTADHLKNNGPIVSPVAAETMIPESNEAAFAADSLMEAATDFEQTGAIHQDSVSAGFVNENGNLKVDAPSIDPSAQFEQASVADNTPLEPGVASRDVDSLISDSNQNLNQVKADISGAADNLTAAVVPQRLQAEDEVRPDAVAAARRALQATTAEMNAVRDEVVTNDKNTAVSGLKSKLEALIPNFDMSKLRKPLVMGAAALLLAIVAFKGYSIVSGGDEMKVAKVSKTKVPDVKANKVEAPKAAVREIGKVEVSAPTPVTDVTDANDKTRDAVEVVAAETGQNSNVEPVKPEVGDRSSQSDLGQNLTSDSGLATDGFVASNAKNQPAKDPTQFTSTNDAITADNASVEVDDASTGIEETKPEAPAAVYDVPANAGPAALVAAASAGDPKALFQIGMGYSDGNTVTRNMAEAAKWFQRSADTGFAPAQYSIGSLFEKGIGVERNIPMASKWYQKAADQGNARAMHNLAVIQATGSPPDIQPDMDGAVVWFQKAANFGIKDSQFNLGILFGQGMGVPQDLGESYKWFALAAKTGDNDAGKKRDEVANAMDPDDLDDARKEVNNWAPRKLNVEVNRVSVPEEWRTVNRAPQRAAASSAESPIKQAQALLNQRGFSVGEPDGLMGPKTKNAIIEFQRSADIPVTGTVDAKLLKALDLQT